MTSDELYELFRSEVDDAVRPYLWTDSDVWRYMNDAYKMFVRLVGGIPDISSDLTEVTVNAAEATSEVSRKILRFKRAKLVSTGCKLKIINYTDQPEGFDDYGVLSSSEDQPGAVHSMVIGEEKGLVRWIQVPEIADTVKLAVDRLPLEDITGGGQELDEIDDEHHEHLLKWMKHRAHSKQDAETFDKGRSEDYRVQFEVYCAQAKAEMDRWKHKNREIAYGGL